MAIESQGTMFFWGSTVNATAGSTSTSVKIAEVVGFSGPTGSAGVIDVTHLGSSAKEKLMGLRDEGQVTLDVNFMPSDTAQTNLRNDRASRTMRKAVIKLNDNSSETARCNIIVDAYCTGFSISGRVDDKITGSITLELANACTFATVV